MDIPVQPRLVTVNDASGDQIRLTGISPQQELLIGQVLENSPAAAAGLLSGDTLLRADGTPLHSIAQLSDILEHAIGKTVAVTVLRGGQEAVLELKPESIPLTRPLAHVFVGKDATQPALEIIPLYPQARASAPAESTATATAPAAVATADAAADTTVVKSADPANPQTTAHLAVFSLPGAPALLSGLRGEWYIESVNGVRTDNIAALADALNAKNKDGNATDDLTIVTSAGARRDLVLTGGAHAEIIPPRTQALVGIILEGGAVLTYPSIANQFRQHLETTFRTLKSLFTPSSDIGVGHLSGPVGIGRAVYSLAISDIRLVLWFTVLLNLNLAILNLLPIPVLDGGHMTIATITRLRGRSLPESFIAGLQGAFMVLLLGLMIYILFKDSMRWYGDSESERAWKRQSLYAIPSRFGPPIKPADAHADAGAANANAAGAATGEADAASDNK